MAQPLTVQLYISELVYDVQTKTFNTAESLKASGKLKYDGAANVMASDDEQSLYELKRAIATAIGDAHVALNEYIEDSLAFDEGKNYSSGEFCEHEGKYYKFNQAHTSGSWNSAHVNLVTSSFLISETNLLSSDIDTITNKFVQLRFEFPSNFKGVYSAAFSNGLHDYVVNRAAYAWYRQVIPEVAQACLADADSALEQVNKAMYGRQRPTRPTLP